MKLSSNEYHDCMSGIANVFLFLGIVLLLVHSFAPLFGGKFLINGIIIYSTWIIFSICVKIEAKCIKEKKIKDLKVIITSLIELACFFVWFPFPYNIIAVFIFLFLKYFGFRAIVKTLSL